MVVVVAREQGRVSSFGSVPSPRTFSQGLSSGPFEDVDVLDFHVFVSVGGDHRSKTRTSVS